MPKRLKKWARRILRREDAASRDQGPPPLPALRPRPLTACPSHKSLIASASAATKGSTFFRKLPPEIRRPILMEAFGDRTVHMDLISDNLLDPVPVAGRADASPTAHCGFKPTGYRPWSLRRTQEVDGVGVKSRDWRLVGSVCHRAPESTLRFGGLERRYFSQPFECFCLVQHGAKCRDWPGEAPRNCWLGVMGWLLSCRQAYTEGIDVFYGTNTFHFRDPKLLSELPSFLLPERLAMIQSAELCWNFETALDAETRLVPFVHLLKSSSACFPNLRRVHVAPHLGWFLLQGLDPDIWYQKWKVDIFTPVAEMMRSLPKLEECILSVPFITFRNHLRSRNTEVENISDMSIPRPFKLTESRVPHEGDTFVVPTPISGYLDEKTSSPEGIERQSHRYVLVIEGVYHDNRVMPCFGQCRITTDSQWLRCGGIAV